LSNVRPLLPRLIVNGTFIRDFLAADAPCFALGVVEERKQQFGFLALRPDVPIPDHATQDGFRLGHSLLGTSTYEVVHFAFEFYGFTTYNVLVNPNNLVVRTILKIMVERPDYFIFVLNASGSATAFRAALDQDDLAGLKANLPRILRSTTTDPQYQGAVAQFHQHSTLPGRLAPWVCRDNRTYLDLTQDRVELTPRANSGARESRNPSDSADQSEEPNWQPLSMLPTIAMILNEEMAGTEEQLTSLQQARGHAAVLDDDLIHRVQVLYSEQLEFIPLHREQLAQWRTASPSKAQRKVITRLTAQLDRHEAVLKDILALAKGLEAETLDAILRMEEGELGLAMFEGRMPLPDGAPPTEALRVRELRAIAAVLDARTADLEEEGIRHLDLLAHMAPQMPMFWRLMKISKGNELSDLGEEYPGFYRFAKLLELVATGIKSGDIQVPR
jgi:hypothetical protein